MKLPVMHVFDPALKRLVEPIVWELQVGMLEPLMDSDSLVEVARGNMSSGAT